VHWVSRDVLAWLAAQRAVAAWWSASNSQDEAVRLADLAPARDRTIIVLGHEQFGIPPDDLAAKAPLLPGMTTDRVGDLLFVLLGPETYRSFVIELGWTPAQWADWTTRALLRDILGSDAISR
jgi:hypothetical protein